MAEEKKGTEIVEKTFSGETTGEKEDDIQEVKKIVEKYLKAARNIEKSVIVFARRTNGNWKVVVRHPVQNIPDADILSMLLINRTTKEVDYFRDNISSY